jgi:hypothetical protein
MSVLPLSLSTQFIRLSLEIYLAFLIFYAVFVFIGVVMFGDGGIVLIIVKDSGNYE